MITEIFGRNAREARVTRGLSQEGLAELSGLHRTYVGAVERGQRNITLLNAEKISHALGVTLAELVKHDKS